MKVCRIFLISLVVIAVTNTSKLWITNLFHQIKFFWGFKSPAGVKKTFIQILALCHRIVAIVGWHSGLRNSTIACVMSERSLISIVRIIRLNVWQYESRCSTIAFINDRSTHKTINCYLLPLLPWRCLWC